MAPKKNSLSIRLAESAIFLRSDHTHSRGHNDSSASSRDSLLRGLLVLDLAKPTRITNIEVQLTAVTAVSCPEGIGARRLVVTERHRPFHTSTILYRAPAPGSYPQKTMTGITSAPHRRCSSIGPGVSYTQTMHRNISSRLDIEDHSESRESSWEANHQAGRSTPSQSRLPSVPPIDVDNLGRNRPPSLDRTDSSLSLSPPPIPPYSLPTPGYLSFPTPTTPSRASSSMFRRPSFTDAIPEDESDFHDGQTYPAFSTEMNPSYIPLPESIQDSRASSLEHRGRPPTRASASKRFSLSAVPSFLRSAVGSASPRRSLFSPEVDSPRERSIGRRPVNPILERLERGRTTERRESTRDSTLEDGELSRERGGKEDKERTSVLAKLLGEREEWSQEFKPGTYTYPITFSIPSSAPPTMELDYGSVSWTLKAFAHRPGTFHSKLSAERDVIVVASPTEDDTEDSESIIVERNWDQKLQYLISISGRAFFIGGTIPINVVLMPMDKVQVHRLTVYIEERVDYFYQVHRAIRSDPPVRTTLLSLRNKNSTPLLPLESSGADALRSSPLIEVLDPEDRRDASKLDELSADFMGPGPWSFHRNFKLPNSCKLMKPSNSNLQANVRVVHLLKVILRVGKALSVEDSQKAKPTLFDIVVQTPVLILSCRCNPEWASLPRYTEVFEDTIRNLTPTCPCQAGQQAPFLSPRSSTDSLVPATGKSSAPPTAVPSSFGEAHDSRQPHSARSEYTESIIRSNSLFERLVSGQATETGEAPPAYDFVNDGTGYGQSSVSVAVREVSPVVVRGRSLYRNGVES